MWPFQLLSLSLVPSPAPILLDAMDAIDEIQYTSIISVTEYFVEREEADSSRDSVVVVYTPSTCSCLFTLACVATVVCFALALRNRSARKEDVREKAADTC